MTLLTLYSHEYRGRTCLPETCLEVTRSCITTHQSIAGLCRICFVRLVARVTASLLIRQGGQSAQSILSLSVTWISDALDALSQNELCSPSSFPNTKPGSSHERCVRGVLLVTNRTYRFRLFVSSVNASLKTPNFTPISLTETVH